jgi:hypothetical protein
VNKKRNQKRSKSLRSNLQRYRAQPTGGGVQQKITTNKEKEHTMTTIATQYRTLVITATTYRYGLRYTVTTDDAAINNQTQYRTFSEAYREVQERERYAKRG